MATWRTLCFGWGRTGGGLKGWKGMRHVKKNNVWESQYDGDCSGWIWWRPKATWRQRWFIYIFVLQRPSMTWHARESSSLTMSLLPRVGQKRISKPGRPTTMPVPSSVIRLGPMSIDDACDACFLQVDNRGLCFLLMLLDFSFVASCIICILLAIFAPELFEFCDLGLVVALGSLKDVNTGHSGETNLSLRWIPHSLVGVYSLPCYPAKRHYGSWMQRW